MTVRLSLPLCLIAATLVLLGCPAKPGDQPKAAGGGAASTQSTGEAADALLLGVPRTADGAVDKEAMKALAFLPALQSHPWDGANYVAGAPIEQSPDWAMTPPFDPTLPVPDMAVQPDPYILELPKPAEHPEAAHPEDKPAEGAAAADAEAEARKGEAQGEATTPRKEKMRERPESIPPPGPDDWVPIAYPEGGHTVAFQAFTYDTEGLTISGYKAQPQNVGTSPTIILLHGLVPADRYSIETHAREARFLASYGYTVLVPDFRNYGASGKVEASPELIRLGWLRDAVNMVQVVRLGRIENADPNRIALIGFGHGGALALKTSVLTRPNAVFVVSPTGQQEFEEQERFANGMAPDIGQAMEAIYGKADNPEVISWYRSMTYTNFAQDLGCPVGIVSGELDPIVPVEDVRGMMAVFTPMGLQCLMSTFPRTGHTFHSHDWVGLMQTIDNFFRQPLQPPPAPGTRTTG